MNSHNTNGWPPGTGGGSHPPNVEQPTIQQRPPGAFGLPNPQNLPPQLSPMQSARGPPTVQHPQQQSPTTLQHHSQPPYGLPSLGPSMAQQPPQGPIQSEREHMERDQRDRIRQEQIHQEMAHQRYEQESDRLNHHREMQARELQAREQQQREQLQSPRENHAGAIPLQQPIASRVPATLHGPNGILNEQHLVSPAHAQPHPPLGAPNGPVNIFGNGNGPGGPPGGAVGGVLQSANDNGLRPFAPQNMPPQQQLLTLTNAVAPQQANGVGALAQGQQPILNDALSYLDQVKVRFQEQPDVYNRFLDIMKDFKSQAIDTPGVIDRVSTLFAGHPELIQGFNTFLPPGYKIECGLNDDPNSIRVTTPMGTTVQQMPPTQGRLGGPLNGIGTIENARQGFYADDHQNGEWSGPQDNAHAENHFLNSRQGALSLFGGQPHVVTEGGIQYEEHAHGEGLVGSLPPGLASGQHLLGLEKRGPVEFNHAIGYVNKIKVKRKNIVDFRYAYLLQNRFASQPEIYKQFLEILQTYQRESKPIQDVYAQVTQLFSSAPDLLEDFKQFLPESAAQAKAQAQAAAKQAEDAAMLSNVRGDSGYLTGSLHAQAQTPRPDNQKMPPMGTFAPPSTGKDTKKRRGAPGSQMTGGAVAIDSGIGPSSGNSKNRGTLGNANKRARVEQAKPTVPEVAPVSPNLVPSIPMPIPPVKDAGNMADGITFFERVKKYLANRQTFNEFLKICNLFNQEIIDKVTLIHKAYSFIGGNAELMLWFKNWLRYDGNDVKIENEARIPSGKVVLSNCRGLGPSYRLLPKRERLRTCAGRDETCKEVLNDEWVSHPTWASEESGFIAHRKNGFEESLHRIEEERHDYDINIEACLRTIQLLEPIAQQIKMMSDEEKYQFKLPPCIGGQSETIYQRVIKKIYDRERGCKVVEDMFRRPSAVVPVLLGRLKQKAEEWKASQREWEKVWREQTNRIFWKSLDHQGINVKIQDKRQFQPKVLHTEIQAKYEEQRRQRIIPWTSVPKYQFKYEFPDMDVVYDCCHLILTQLHHNHVGNDVDKTRLDTFIKTFISTFFDIDRDAFEEKMTDIYDATPPSEDADEDTNADAETNTARGRRGGNGKKPNLLRGVLDRHKQAQRDDGADESGATTPDVQSNDEDTPASTGTPTEQPRADPAEHRWMAHPLSGNSTADLNVPFKRDTFHLYATSNIYCFFRMFQGLYERLSNVKANEQRVHQDISRAKMSKPAYELGLIDKTPTDYFADINPSTSYYKQIVQMCEDVVKQEMEQSHLEETLRRFYMQDGWQLYSFDKMLSAILRFALQILVSDNKDKSLDIINLFYKDRKEDETTHQNELTYRKQVEKFGKDGDIFRIRYNRPSRTAYVQIFKKDDKTYEADELAAAARWSYYVSTYSMLDRTEGISLSRLRAPYLRRNMPAFLTIKENPGSTDEVADDKRYSVPMYNYDGLVIRISPNNYHILYDPHTSDWWVQSTGVRKRGLGAYDEIREQRRKGMEALVEGKERNAWMKEMEDGEIQKTKDRFRRWVKDGPTALGLGGATDAVMGGT
ncbi:MAG: hypothetical protein Q9163_003245 [Psora crenata]